MIPLSDEGSYDKAESVMKQLGSSPPMDASPQNLCGLRSGKMGPISKHGKAKERPSHFPSLMCKPCTAFHRVRKCAEDDLRTALKFSSFDTSNVHVRKKPETQPRSLPRISAQLRPYQDLTTRSPAIPLFKYLMRYCKRLPVFFSHNTGCY